MTTFSNPRLAAIACERMRGCLFAENFVSLTTMAANNATQNGTGNTCNRGFITDGNGYASFGTLWFEFDDVYTVVVRFSAAAVTDDGILFATDNLIGGGTAARGVCVWVDADGIKANHSDSGGSPTECAVDVAYADGETHTATYVIDLATGEHALYVDALDEDTQTTTVSWPSATLSSACKVGGDGTDNFVGTIYKARLFHASLTEEEHDLYHADTLTSFWNSMTAAYRCDSMSDDTGGNKLADSTTNLNNLDKADRATSAAFPEFDVDKYSFDLVDDYLTGPPSLGAAYTVSGCVSIPQIPLSEIRQELTDETFLDELTTAAGYWGYLHNLTLHTKELTTLEQLHAEYMQLRFKSRQRAMYHSARLCYEGVCKLAVFMDADPVYFLWRDYSLSRFYGQATGVTREGIDGVSFPNSDSRIDFPSDESFGNYKGTFVVFGDFDSPAITSFMDGSNGMPFYYLSGGTNYIYFVSSKIEYDLSNNTQLCVSFSYNKKPRFYVDGEYIGDGDIATTNYYNAQGLIIGNRNSYVVPSAHNIKHAFYFDDTLTDQEIRALYQSSRLIGATEMETGNRVETTPYSSSTAVAMTADPGGAFQLLDIHITIDTAPTSAGSITVYVKRDGTNKRVIHTHDPVAGSTTNLALAFDRRFNADATYGVDYANPDSRTVTVESCYQLDQSVV